MTLLNNSSSRLTNAVVLDQISASNTFAQNLSSPRAAILLRPRIQGHHRLLHLNSHNDHLLAYSRQVMISGIRLERRDVRWVGAVSAMSSCGTIITTNMSQCKLPILTQARYLCPSESARRAITRRLKISTCGSGTLFRKRDWPSHSLICTRLGALDGL